MTPVVDGVGLFVWKQRIRRLSRGKEQWVDPRRLLYVQPGAIHRALDREELLSAVGVTNRRELVGVEAAGSWDTSAFPVVESAHLEAFRLHFEAGADWSEIPFFRSMEQAVLQGRPDRRYRYRTIDDLHARWAHADALYSDIREEGYRTQAELRSSRPWEEVNIAIDRMGRIIFVDGIHRLAIARALKIDRIPTLVGVRHQKWCEFTTDLRADVADSDGLSYQPIVHPDLDDIPSHKGHDRFDLIDRALPMRSGPLLDIGANRGYFCHRFEDAGFQCVAVERSRREGYFLRRLRDASEKNFEIIEGSIENVDSGQRQYSVVLALNIFHHFLKTREGYESLTEFLAGLETECLVFEPHLPEESQMKNAYRNFDATEFVQFVMNASRLGSCRPIGYAADGRPLYILSR